MASLFAPIQLRADLGASVEPWPVRLRHRRLPVAASAMHVDAVAHGGGHVRDGPAQARMHWDCLVGARVAQPAGLGGEAVDVRLGPELVGLLGAKVAAPTIDGPVSLTIPKGASSGRVLRLRGRGVAPAGRAPGDQRVELRIVAPLVVDDGLAAFLEEWRKDHPHDPRAELFRGMPT